MKMVALKSLVVDQPYQCPPKPALVTAIAANTRWQLFLTPNTEDK